jgi:hypothetical protein
MQQSHTAEKIRSGSCSADRGCGDNEGYSQLAMPFTSPVEETAIAFVLVVPISTPIK